MLQNKALSCVSGASRTAGASAGARRPSWRHQPLRVAAEAAPQHKSDSPSPGGRPHPAPPGAYPQPRPRASTLHPSVLRSQSVPRQQLLERYRNGGGGGEAIALQRRPQDQQQGDGSLSAPPAQAAATVPQPEEAAMSRDAVTLVLLATAVSFICSIDRSALSVAILPMSEQFSWDDGTKGAISSAFFAGYMVTNLCGGFLATRYSAKTVLASGVVLWSIFTIATPAAAGGNLNELMMARALMGIGEGVTYPSIQNLARKWVPEEKRSRALAFIYSGHQLGTIGSYVLCPMLIAQLGWESIFWIFGSLGFVWLLGWMPLVQDNPPVAAAAVAAPAGIPQLQAPGSAQATTATAAVAVAAPAPAEKLRLSDVPWAQFARSPAFWAIVAAQCSVSVGNVLAFSWLPTFYNQVYGVDIAASSAFSVLPFVVTVMTTNAAGWIADGLVNNKVMGKTKTRKLMQAIASLGPAVCLLKLAADQGQGSASVFDAVAIVTAWISLGGFSAAGYGSNHQDISKEYSGILFGLSNGLASVAASVSIYATGQVLHQTHDWSLVFEAAAVLYGVGALAYLAFASSEEQFSPEAGKGEGNGVSNKSLLLGAAPADDKAKSR